MRRCGVNYKEHTKLHLHLRQLDSPILFYSCAEYRAFLAVSQVLPNDKEKIRKAQCLMITLKRALLMCTNCQKNAGYLEDRHKIRVTDG